MSKPCTSVLVSPKWPTLWYVVSVPCQGTYNINIRAALSFSGKLMLIAAHQLLAWSPGKDYDLTSFSLSMILAKSGEMLLPFYGMMVWRARDVKQGFASFGVGVVRTEHIIHSSRKRRVQRWDHCIKDYSRQGAKYIVQNITCRFKLPGRKTKIECITNNLAKAKLEIVHQRAQNKILKKELGKALLEKIEKDESINPLSMNERFFGANGVEITARR